MGTSSAARGAFGVSAFPSFQPDPVRSQVLVALLQGNVPTLRRLLEAGFPPNTPLGQEPTSTPLLWVLLERSAATLDQLQALLDHGVSLAPEDNGGGHPILFVADGVHSDQSVEVLDRLLPLLPPSWKTTLGEGSKPLLATALRWGQNETAARLHAAGAPDAVDGGTTTALIEAIKKDDVGWVNRLLEGGADPNGRDIDGFTPLHRACETRRTQAGAMILALLAAGADPTATWALGTRRLTPEDMARDSGCQEALVAFEAHRLKAALPAAPASPRSPPRL